MNRNPLCTHRIIFALILVCTIAISCGERKPEVATETKAVTDTIVQNASVGLDRINYMRLSDGAFLNSQPTFDNIPITSRDDLKASFDSLTRSKDDIVIYFHGGLMSIKKAFTDPKKSGLDLAFHEGKSFPFYMLYGGGPGNILWTFFDNRKLENDNDEAEDFADVEKGSLDAALDTVEQSNSFIYLMIQFNRKYGNTTSFAASEYSVIRDTSNAGLKRIFETEISSPLVASKQREVFIDNDKYQQKFLQNLLEDSILNLLANEEESPGSAFAGSKKVEKKIIGRLYSLYKIIRNLNRRFRDGRNHQVIMTLFEEIVLNSSNKFILPLRKLVVAGWEKSKEQVSNAFTRTGGNIGGTALLDELLRLNLSQGGRKVTLIGSSTGTIMICHLLKKVARDQKYSSLRFNVIFSVPSCTMELFAETITKAKSYIIDFHMFALRDEVENSCGAFPLFKGSILYFVSGFCESDNSTRYHDMPLVGMQRFYNSEFNTSVVSFSEKKHIKIVRDFLQLDDQGRSEKVIWSQVQHQNPALGNGGTRHVNVIRNDKVLSSIKYLLLKD